MNILVPAALAFAAIIPIILLFYFMRPKRQERLVGSTLLWRRVLQDLQASNPWQRLRFTPLLLLQLLAAAIIVIVLIRPTLFLKSAINGDTIFILQTSASMQATDVAPSRFQEAKKTITNLTSSLGPNDHVSVLTMGRTPQIVLANANDSSQIRTALDRVQVTNQEADLEQALALANSLAVNREHAQIVVVGDGHTLNPQQILNSPIPVRYYRLGEKKDNLAFLALNARTVQGQLLALAQVSNYSEQPHAVPVELYADGQLVSVQTINLAAGASGALQWALPPQSRILHARLVFEDALKADQEAWSLVGSSLHAKVLLVSKGNTFLRSALKLQTNLELNETTPEQYTGKDTFDLTIFDGFVPPTLPSGSLFFLNSPEGTYPFATSGPQIAVTNLSPANNSLSLLDSVDLGSVRTISSSHKLDAPNWMQPVLQSTQTPLLLAGEQNNQRFAVLGFDLHASDLPLQPAFPILIHNLTNWFLPPPVAGNGQISPGLPLVIQAWPGAEEINITSPDQQTTRIGPPVTPYIQTDKLGIYEVQQKVHGQEIKGEFAINVFSGQQSQLAPTATLPIAHSTDFSNDPNQIATELREIWPWIALLLLAILGFEWWLFSRSYQTRSANKRPISGPSSRQKTFWGRTQSQIVTTYLQTQKRMKKQWKQLKHNFGRPLSRKEQRRVKL